MKHIISAILILIALPTYAIELEISAGTTQFQRPDNGIWWQNGPSSDGFSTTFDSISPSYSIGITDRFRNGLRWRTSYMRLGNVSSNAQATNLDPEYNGTNGCVGPCPPLSTYKTESSVRGFSLSVAPEMQLFKGVKGFVELGAFVYFPKFTIDKWTTNTGAGFYHNEYRESWQVGAQIGMGLEFGNTQLVLTAYKVDAHTPDADAVPNWQGWITNVSIRQRF